MIWYLLKISLLLSQGEGGGLLKIIYGRLGTRSKNTYVTVSLREKNTRPLLCLMQVDQ